MKSINKVKKFVKEFKPIEIKEPFKTDVIEFNDATEFTKYYREHEDEFTNMTTYKLNMRYKIPGYKISQSKHKDDNTDIKLVKDYRTMHTTIDNTANTSLNDLLKRIDDLEKRIINIESYLSNDN